MADAGNVVIPKEMQGDLFSAKSAALVAKNERQRVRRRDDADFTILLKQKIVAAATRGSNFVTWTLPIGYNNHQLKLSTDWLKEKGFSYIIDKKAHRTILNISF